MLLDTEMVVLQHHGYNPDFTQDESDRARMRGNTLIRKE